MALPEYEKLFLLEVLVDSVHVDHANLDLDPAIKSNLKETCVMFQFLNYPPLVVCEEDFYKAPPGNNTELNFKSGKSCIFSTSSSMIPLLPYKFDINVSIVRKVDQPNTSTKVVLGSSKIDLGDSFTAIMHSSVVEPDLPLQKIKTGTFELFDERGKRIGQITAFIRLSCFGQLIVTQFQVGKNKDAFMFKGTEPKDTVDITGNRCMIPKIEKDPNYVYPGDRRAETESPPPRQPADTNKGYGDWNDKTGRRPRTGHPEMGTELVPYQLPPTEPPGNYKEIVAEIRGHSLYIRVPMRPKKTQEEEPEEPPICKYAPPLNLCDCDFPVPPEAIPRCDR